MLNTQFCFTKLSPKLVVVCLVHLRGLFLSEAIGSTGESLWLLRLSSNNSSTLSLFFVSSQCIISYSRLLWNVLLMSDTWSEFCFSLLRWWTSLNHGYNPVYYVRVFFRFEIEMEWNQKDFLLWSIRKKIHFIWTKPLFERSVFKPFSLRSSQSHHSFLHSYIINSLIFLVMLIHFRTLFFYNTFSKICQRP